MILNQFCNMQDDVDELLYNPFVTSIDYHTKPLSISPQETSSIDLSTPSTPSDKSNNLGFNHEEPHDNENNTEASSRDHHPLRSIRLSNGLEDAGVTRPHLTRILGHDRLVDGPSNLVGEGHPDKAAAMTDEKVVIVHEVSPTDSLAGVALKYRINLTELRRANHLWTSDSIHLRKYLYIPLEKTSLPIPPSTANSSSSSSEVAASVPPTPEDPKSSVTNTIPSSTLRRVPASELSFFPPSRPLTSSSTLSPPAPSNLSASNNQTSRIRHTPSPAPSLNSILTALPIAPSTRDMIIARLSLDSLSMSYNDRDRSSYMNGYEGHELADVQARVSSRHSLDEDRQRYFPGTGPKQTTRRQINHPLSNRVGNAAATTNGKVGAERLGPSIHARSFSEGYGVSPSTPSISPTRTIRNVQLEPSPVMQIPIRNNRDVRISGQKKVDISHSILDLNERRI
ncbi:peptidoglycan-binding LysM domain protein [Lentinula raphanica]|nr:peptidoglycan-binding LysM domain protein [Lentinula raphanica]